MSDEMIIKVPLCRSDGSVEYHENATLTATGAVVYSTPTGGGMSKLHSAARPEIEAQVAARKDVTYAIQHDNGAWFVVDSTGGLHDYPDDMPKGWKFHELRRFSKIEDREREEQQRITQEKLAKWEDLSLAVVTGGPVTFDQDDLKNLAIAYGGLESEGLGPPAAWFDSMIARVAVLVVRSTPVPLEEVEARKRELYDEMRIKFGDA